MKILVVEDEVPTAGFLRRGLTEEGFAVDVASDARCADESVHAVDYDAILLDVMLPGGDGFSLCKRWREMGLTLPIIFLTARDEIRDRVQGLDFGADDYLIKPFAFDELLARLRAAMRKKSPGEAPVIRVGDLTIDSGRRRVTRGTRVIPLTAREYALLEHLARHKGRVVSRMSLWNHVWESGREPDSNVIDVYVRYLRRKLGREPELIETVRGAGYRMPVTEE